MHEREARERSAAPQERTLVRWRRRRHPPHPAPAPAEDWVPPLRQGSQIDVLDARAIAHASLADRRDRRGDLMIEHVARVAAAVPPEAQVVAWLHDVAEHSPVTLESLRRLGLSGVEAEALMLLTRLEGETYEAHVLGIAYAHGPAAALARTVKLSDLDDHLARPWVCGDPPYAWARRHLVNATNDSTRAAS